MRDKFPDSQVGTSRLHLDTQIHQQCLTSPDGGIIAYRFYVYVNSVPVGSSLNHLSL